MSYNSKITNGDSGGMGTYDWCPCEGNCIASCKQQCNVLCSGSCNLGCSSQCTAACTQSCQFGLKMS